MASLAIPDELVAGFNGRLVGPDDAAYDEVRAVHNGLVDRHPGLIARCQNVADVRDAVMFGRERGAGDLGPRRRAQCGGPGRHRGRADDRPVADARSRRRPRPPSRAGAGRDTWNEYNRVDPRLRAGDHRRGDLDHRGVRPDAGRRSGLVDGQVRHVHRQPPSRRGGHR